MKRTLSLKREALVPLTTSEMADLGAAGSLPTVVTIGAVASLDPLTTCVAVRESILQCSGSGCDTWNSDCSCAP